MKIPGGTTLYIGPPAKPISKHVSDAIGKALANVSDIVEAHLPMIYAKGWIDPPAQVLVVVLAENSPSPQAKIMEVLSSTLSADLDSPFGQSMTVVDSFNGDQKEKQSQESQVQEDGRETCKQLARKEEGEIQPSETSR